VGLGAAYLLQIPAERDWPGEPFLLFLLVVIGTTLCFGARLGLISAAISAFLSLYFFEPVGSPTLRYASDLNKIALYAIMAFGCVVGFARLIDMASLRMLAEQDSQRLAAIVASSEDAIISKDLNGIVTSWNPGAEQLFGYAPAELIGQSIALLIPTHLQYEESNILKRIALGERIEHFETTRVRKDGTLVRVSLSISPIRNAHGSVVGVSSIARNITHHKQAEQALAERNAQLALAGRAALVGSYAYDVNKGTMQVTEGYAAIHGLPERTTETTIREWQERVHPEDLARAEGVREQAFAELRSEDNAEYRIVLSNGEIRWIERRGAVSYGESGRAERVVGVNIDVTERRRMEQALTDRNRQLQLAGKAALVGSFAIEIDVAREDFTSNRMHFSPGFAAIYGLPEETVEISLGDWRSLVFPDDLPQFLEHRQQLFDERRGEHHAEFRIVHPCGTIRWIEARSFIEYDQAGHARRLVGVNIDITERKRAEEARKILNAELDHRVKNALATVTAVISHTRQGSGSVADFAVALDGRIRSMATTHELLSSHQWHGVSLMELVRRELAPYATRNNTEINGPAVLLKPEAGRAIAMVLHELTTNAAKYGAFSNKNGRVAIRWGQYPNGHPLSHLVFEWQEIGGPPVIAVGRPSYGTSTIRDLIPYEFSGTVDLVLAPEGARCRLELPSDCLGNDSNA
jgi:PAS domain S-box-containing protein